VDQNGKNFRDERCFDCGFTGSGLAVVCSAGRVIKGQIEHVYGPGGALLDDADFQARNQRAWDRMQAEKRLAIESRRKPRSRDQYLQQQTDELKGEIVQLKSGRRR
jgi:hypothetical protein